MPGFSYRYITLPPDHLIYNDGDSKLISQGTVTSWPTV